MEGTEQRLKELRQYVADNDLAPGFTTESGYADDLRFLLDLLDRLQSVKNNDCQRVLDWMRNPEKPPHLEFTAGPMRELADEIQMMKGKGVASQ